MKDKGKTAPSLALACGLSRSLIEKLMSNESKRPSMEAVVKIEDALSVRIWSSPSEFKSRRALQEFEAHVNAIAATHGVDHARAVELARERFPKMLAITSEKK